MAKAMIISVGGTPQPLIKSIEEYEPEFVSFFASQDTCDNISQIKAAVSQLGLIIKTELTIVDDVNSLLHCHEKAEEAVERVLAKSYRKEDVLVDYTGGTKNMSVALALATVTHGFSFSYVGGHERTKEGVGIVINGREQVYQSLNPWDFLAIEEKKKIALLFNQFQFKAAKDLADDIVTKTTKNRSLFKKVGFLIEGYSKWDLFRHQEAIDLFRKAKIEEILESDDKSFKLFAKETQAKFNFLDAAVDSRKKPSTSLILDMYSNAERRFEEGKIDDAILRIYRLVEMIVQYRLLNAYGIEASDVKQDKIPEILREEFVRKHKSLRDGKIKIPQTDAFHLLEALGDNIGKVFKTNEARFLDIQSARNYSYLAHGFDFSKEKTYLSLKNFILDLHIFKADEAPIFPKILI